MGFISYILPLIVAAIFVAGELMQHKQEFPRVDLLLAGTTASPAVAHAATGFGSRPVPLFSAPLVEFQFHGLPVFLTIPDCLALLASIIMAIRFAAWASAPLRKGGGDD